MKNKKILIGLGLLFCTNIHLLSKDASEIVIEQAFGALFNGIATIVTHQANDNLDRKKDETPKEKAELELIEKNKILVDKQIANQEKSMISLEQQMEDHKIDKLSKQFDLLQKFNSLPGKQKNKDGKIKLRRVEKAIATITDDLPELTEEELKELDKDNKDTPKPGTSESKTRLLSRITAPLTVALTSAGDFADFLAANSFAHITSLDCFKDTFIQAHAKNINRALVVTAAAAVAFVGYKLYKKVRNADGDEDYVDDSE